MEKNSKAIGIDLGTTYSCVGIYRNGVVEILPNEMGRNITPSVVSFYKKERLIGDNAKAQITKNYKNTVYDAKRLIGRRFNDPEIQKDIKKWPFTVKKELNSERPIIEVEYLGTTKTFYPEEISAMVLLKMKKIAEEYLGREVKDAIITVPAYFNDSQRQATKDAGRIAGLNVMRMINEPTAAAVAYGLQETIDEEKKVLVFDLGGGTFDVSVLVVEDRNIEVRGTSGDTHLGGEDFDNKLMDICMEQFSVDISNNEKAKRRLKNECENAKRTLSSATEVSINIGELADGEDLNVTILRSDFENKCKEYFDKCIPCIEEALKSANLKKEEIDEIILIGGSTRIPKIKKIVKEYFGKEPKQNINADEAVAYGAAYQAYSINDNDEDDGLEKLVLIDVTPLSLGIVTKGGIMNIILKKNIPIPCSKTKTYKTTVDNLENVDIIVYQGERKLVKDNHKIGKFNIKIQGREPAGKIKIKVTFSIDVNSVLTVTAIEINGNNEKKLEIEAQTMKMPEEEIERRIEEAKIYEEQDKRNVAAIRAKTALQDLCFKERNNNNNNEELKKFINSILTNIKGNPGKEKEYYENIQTEFLKKLKK